MKVFVAHHFHRTGNDYRVFKTAKKAEAWRRKIAKDFWTDDIVEPFPKKKSPKLRADLYFRAMAKTGYLSGREEYFNVSELEVE